MKNQQRYIELSLVILLVVLMYQNSHFLNNLVAHPLAKLVLLVVVVVITHLYGRNAGIILSLILLLLLHTSFEGMENKDKDSESDDESDADDESDCEEDDEESDDDDDSDDKDKKEGFFRGLLGKNMKDKTELEDEVRKPKDSNKQKTGLAPNPQLANNENDPLSMPSKTKEGFAILN